MLNLNDYTIIGNDQKISKNSVKYIHFEKTFIKVLSKAYIYIEKDDDDETLVSEGEFTTFGEFKIYLETENINTLYCFNFRLPFLLTFNFDEIEENSSYYFFTLEANKNLTSTNLIEQSWSNAGSILHRLFLGKFNQILNFNYEEIVPAIMEVMEKNNFKGFHSLVYEILVSTLTRQKNDKTKEFRLVATEKEKGENFQMINVREIPRNFSAMSSLVSEGINDGILNTITNKHNGYSSSFISPQEKIILGKL